MNTPESTLVHGATAIFQCDGVTACYDRIPVIFGIDLELARGEVLAILGPNGAGKSSLLGSIAGVVQGAGRIELRGKQLGNLPAHARAAAGLAFVPEGRRNIFPTLSVADNLKIGLRLAPKSERDRIARFIVRLFPSLEERIATSAAMLSGGEQQMLAISVALGRDPTLLILDEPSQGLAPSVLELLEDALAELRTRDLAIILAEQNIDFASRLADRYIVLSQGKAVASGFRKDITDIDKIAAAYFDVPGAVNA
jgi:branched-chain amino acid transport system ATP-binding protein